MQKKYVPLLVWSMLALFVLATVLVLVRWNAQRQAPPPAVKVTTEAKAPLPRVITLYQPGEGESDLAVFVSKELAREQRGLAVFRSIDVSDEPQMAGFFGVSALPAIVFQLPSGKVAAKYEGYVDKNRILAVVRSLAAN
jgi:thioredoxin-like negative regulator of GroEL